VQDGVLASYASQLSTRDAEQLAISLASANGPPRPPAVATTPDWSAYDSPERRRTSRRLHLNGENPALAAGVSPGLVWPAASPRSHLASARTALEMS